MLKNWGKNFKNIKNQAKNHSRMSKNHEKCRNLEKQTKMSKNR